MENTTSCPIIVVGMRDMEWVLTESNRRPSHRKSNLARPAYPNGRSELMDQIYTLFPQPCDHTLEVRFITEVFSSEKYCPISDPDLLVEQGMQHLSNINDALIGSNFYRNHIFKAIEFLKRGLSLAEACGDYTQQAQVLNNLSSLAYRIGDYSGAYIHAREAQQKAQLAADLYQEVIALQTKVRCHAIIGKNKEAIVLCQQGNQLLNLCGILDGPVAHRSIGLEAVAHQLRSEYPEARNLFHKLSQNTSAESDPWHHALSRLNIAEILVITGGAETDVDENLHKAKEIFSAMKFHNGLIHCEMVSADLKLTRGEMTDARVEFEQGLISSWGKDVENVDYCLERLASVSRWGMSDLGWSCKWPVVYLVHALKSKQRFELHKALQCLADLFQILGDDDTAHNLFTVALEGFTQLEFHKGRAACLLCLGGYGKEEGKLDEGCKPLDRISTTFRTVTSDQGRRWA
ncbi:hypothetical protein DFH09DRAFT_1075453 [Mycena vulgaris]|nr:hypothetical protein DFH09DRAFT_1075453 [Mycena vulgaris]